MHLACGLSQRRHASCAKISSQRPVWSSHGTAQQVMLHETLNSPVVPLQLGVTSLRRTATVFHLLLKTLQQSLRLAPTGAVF